MGSLRLLTIDPGIYTGGGVLADSRDLRSWDVLDAIGVEQKRRKRGGRARQVQVVTPLHGPETEAWGADRRTTSEIMEAWLLGMDHDWAAADVIVVEGIAYHASGKGRGGAQLVDLVEKPADLAGWLRGRTGVRPYRPGWSSWVRDAWPGSRRLPKAAEVTRACIRDAPRWGFDLGKLAQHGHVSEAVGMGRVGALRVSGGG